VTDQIAKTDLPVLTRSSIVHGMTESPDGPPRSGDLDDPVYWSVLGLVGQRPGWREELVFRYEEAYGQHRAAPARQIYAGIAVLERRELIETFADAAHAASLGPRYRAENSLVVLDGRRPITLEAVVQASGDHTLIRLLARSGRCLAHS
jgi:hypothetical protein